MNSTQPNQVKSDILIVDDALSSLQLLSNMLTEQGYKVRGASNGPTALMIAGAEPPDLILLDIVMPEMDGYEVCRQLKSKVKTRNIPVIFISGLEEVVDKVKAFAVGGVDYITKPFRVEEVLARVQTHLTLHDLQNELEQRVEERTAELAQANASLKVEMTERKRAEEVLKEYSEQLEEMVEERAQKLQEAQQQLVRQEKLALLGQLGGGMAHELRNPLGVIKNIVYYLNMALEQPEEDVREML